MQGLGAQSAHETPGAAFAVLPGAIEGLEQGARNDAQQGFPVLAVAQHQGFVRMLAGGPAHGIDQWGIDAWHIAGQYQDPGVPGGGEAGPDACQWSRKIATVVLHQLIGVRCVLLLIAVAGDDEIVAQAARQPVQVGDQGLPLPFDQPLVPSPHALAASPSQEQDGAGRQICARGHVCLHRGGQRECCDITPGRFSYNWIEPMKAKADVPFVPLNIAVLTVSDTRTLETDTSGQVFIDRLGAAGHNLAARVLLKDDLYKIRAQVATWIADDVVQVVLITGGTGFTGRDSTPEAVSCLLDKQVDGFGELFRQISVADIGTSTVQSRALAGLANGTLVCCLPGSTNAVRTGWDGILAEQLDARHRPCNFVAHLKQAAPCESRG